MEVLKYFIIFFPISLSNIGFISNLRITISDVTLILIFLYAMICKRRLVINNFSINSIIFFFLLFLINIFNILFVEGIDVNNIIFNYLKFLLLISIVLFLPTLINKEKLSIYYKSLMLVIILHSIIIIISSKWGLFWRLDGHLIVFENYLASSFRPSSLFGESSFWGVFLITYICLIMQYEINSKDKVIKWWHVFLISVSVLIVKSVTCYLAMILLISYYIYNRVSLQSNFLLAISFFLAMFLLSSIEIDMREINGSEKETYLSSNFQNKLLITYFYLKERMINFLTFSDGSANQRLIGSFLYSLHVLEQSPLLGSGLGSENLSLIYKDKNFYSFDYLIFNEYKQVPITYSKTTYFAVLIGSGGVFTLLYFYIFILGRTMLNYRTMFFGFFIFILGFSNGGVFQEHFWITLTIILYLKSNSSNKVLPS